jgi:hypothetical protein
MFPTLQSFKKLKTIIKFPNTGSLQAKTKKVMKNRFPIPNVNQLPRCFPSSHPYQCVPFLKIVRICFMFLPHFITTVVFTTWLTGQVLLLSCCQSTNWVKNSVQIIYQLCYIAQSTKMKKVTGYNLQSKVQRKSHTWRTVKINLDTKCFEIVERDLINLRSHELWTRWCLGVNLMTGFQDGRWHS